MTRYRFVGVVLAGVLLLATGCGEERGVAPPPVTGDGDFTAGAIDPQQVAQQLVAASGWEIDPAAAVAAKSATGNPEARASCVLLAERIPLTRDIVHYSYQVQVGPGPHDVIGLHRVVKEARPCRPIRTPKSVFLQHGASTDFVFCYLPGQYSDRMPDDFGFAVYLAEHDVDVWGIDQRWCLVPAEESDVSFMATWDFPMHINDLGLGVNVARLMRCMTGNGLSKMLLLGFSFGAEISFGLVDGEAQLPPGQRSVKGFIPVDMVIKVPEDSPWRELMCSFQPYYEAQLAAGVYGEGALFRPAGILARDDPAGASPFFPGLTNYQAALAIGTTLLYGVPPFHLFAGVFDGELPTGMQFISNEAWIEMMCRMSAVESNVASLDQCREICGGDVPWGRHWAQIRVPVFFVTGRGGFGEAGLYQLGLLGSTDVSSLVVSTNPDDALLDFGHLDLWLTTRAEALVWQPVLDWIVSHSSSPAGASPAQAVSGSD